MQTLASRALEISAQLCRAGFHFPRGQETLVEASEGEAVGIRVGTLVSIVGWLVGDFVGEIVT